MMDERKGWLERVLDDASADVESWPSWMKDKDAQRQERKCTHDGPGQEGEKRQSDKNQHFD